MSLLSSLAAHPIATAIAVVIIAFIGGKLKAGYDTRRRFHSLPGPTHSWIWGHLKVMDEVMRELPPRVHPHVLTLRIKEKYNIKTDYFYMDLWPFAEPMLHVFDPRLATDIAVDHVLPKHAGMRVFMDILAGPGDMVSSNGQQWKRWRSVFNPGFAASHLMTLVPSIVDQTEIFTGKLAAYSAADQIFRLEEDATRLTVDIIGKVALDLQLGTQTGENEMITAFREQVFLCPNEGPRAPFKLWYPTGIYKRWRNARIMNGYIGKVLDERFAKESSSNGSTAPGGQRKQRKRAIIDLALEEYHRSKGAPTSVSKDQAGIDEEFKRAATTQIRTFIFAGHDTTSSTIAYAIYMLQKHPTSLAKIRAEHDRVLGSVEGTPDLIRKEPHIINKLEYTTAVIRETLRLWTPASGTRQAAEGMVIRDPDTGEALPVDNVLVWVVINAMHRNSATWGPTANDFRPERFLTDQSKHDGLDAGAWMPFGRGPRNCIGQDLAMVEARIILALMVRSFDFELALGELEALKGDGSFWARDEGWRVGRQDWDGEELYQILIGTAKPREGMPVRVRKVR